MAIFNRMKLNKIDRLRLFFNSAHIFGLLSILTILAIVIPKHGVEEKTVGEFELNITFQICVLFYISSGLLLITVVIGYVAQRWPDKSSFWIFYCSLLSVVSVVLLAASSSSYANVRSTDLGVDKMKRAMEDQDNNLSKNNTKESRWDKLQSRYKCCGINSYQDWQDVGFGRTSLRVPLSCCLPEVKTNNTLCGLVLPQVPDAEEKIYTKGCKDPALRDVKSMMRILYYVGFFVAATHSILTILSCYLVVSKKV